MLTVYSVARHRPRRPALLALAVALACVWGSIPFSPTGSAPDHAFTALIVFAPWLAGMVIRERQLHIDELDRRHTELKERSHAHTRLAVLAARDRMSREMHDVLTHTLGMMVVQLGGIEQIMRADPVRAAGAIAGVRASGKDALSELRAALAGEQADDPGAGPGENPGAESVANPGGTQGLARLPPILDSLRQAGMDIGFHDPQGPAVRTGLPSTVRHAVLRIVQESLTNILNHSPGSAAIVSLEAGPHRLHLTVANDRPQPFTDPPRTTQPGGATPGAGISGMKERARLSGGKLAAGPTAAGGFRVRANFPVQAP